MYNQEGWTALYGAAMKGHMEILMLLLDRGADIDIVDMVSNIVRVEEKATFKEILEKQC